MKRSFAVVRHQLARILPKPASCIGVVSGGRCVGTASCSVALHIVVTQNLGENHVAKWCAFSRCKHQTCFRVVFSEVVQYLKCSCGQWNTMSNFGFHSVGRNGPDCPVDVDLLALRAADFTGANCGQDEQFKHELALGRRSAVQGL